MRVFLIFPLLISAAMCASLVHKPANLKENLKKSLFSKVEVLDECTNSVYTDPNGGIISSPNYPGNYSNDLTCTYLIDLRASSAESVLLEILDLETEERFDYVNVYDGPSTSDRLILRASGSAIPPPVQSTTGQMLVEFTTDYSESFRGFSAAYSNGGPPGPPTGCGLTYTEMTGNFTSLNYPGDYATNLVCDYRIDLRSLGASSITLLFLDFQTEFRYDTVSVYEGLTTSFDQLLLEASGPRIPAPVVSTTAQMLVRFSSDSTNVDRGFFATYEGM